MDTETLIRLIKIEFPYIKWKRLRTLTHGWDHVIVILDNKIIFRARKKANPDLRFELYDETQLLNYLGKRITSVGIPHYRYIIKGKTAAGYTLLAGRELTATRFGKLSPREKEKVVRSVSAFLTILHSTPKNILAKCHVRRDNSNAHYRKLVQDTKKFIFPRLGEADIQLIKDYFDSHSASADHNNMQTLVHNDLTAEHILWDPGAKKINIIDFSDRVIGDAAIDFAGLLEYGEKFTTGVLDLYRGKKDDRMMTRARWYYRRVPLYIMADAFKGYPCTFKEGYKMFKERFCNKTASARSTTSGA